MWHVVAHARPRSLVFRTWDEGLDLWNAIARHVSPVACSVLPDHVHVLLRRQREEPALVRALVVYAKWRNARRGERGSVWCEGIGGTPVRGTEHAKRTMRYIHLNPCRAELADDPLAWPLSTHRECVGLTLRPMRAAVRDAASFHAWVSADPSVHVEGTALPSARSECIGEVQLEKVRAAVSALMRSTPAELSRRGPARMLLVRAARQLCGGTNREVAHFCGLGVRALQRASAAHDGRVHLVERVLGDPRFSLLPDGDLRHLEGWRASRHRR
jgi:REP element-mobilizing transposase RayT